MGRALLLIVRVMPTSPVQPTLNFQQSTPMMVPTTVRGDAFMTKFARRPDLCCEGSLSWIDVKPGEIVLGYFTVENIGDSRSELSWEIESYPQWGNNWTFTP